MINQTMERRLKDLLGGKSSFLHVYVTGHPVHIQKTPCSNNHGKPYGGIYSLYCCSFPENATSPNNFTPGRLKFTPSRLMFTPGRLIFTPGGVIFTPNRLMFTPKIKNYSKD